MTQVGAAGTDRRLVDFQSRIRSQADRAARMYLAGRENGQPDSLEAKRIIESVLSPSYDGRTLIELLQNGHDAHPRETTDGSLAFLLDLAEGDFGALYVANGGKPVCEENFEALCRVAMSSKRPDEAIGNKGVGFKSVLNLSDCPEVFSKATTASPAFDGFCFRFARPDDFADVAVRVCPSEPGLSDELRANVASLKVPVPLVAVPPNVSRFASYAVTVVRLQLRDGSAQERAIQQLRELGATDAPLHLFLPRVARIRVTVAGGDDDFRMELSRETQQVLATPELSADQVRLQDGSDFIVLRRPVAEAEVLAAVDESVTSGRLAEGWLAWQGDAEVAVALRLDAELTAGRLFTFLPMGPSALAPMPAFVNAPFFPDVDRRDLQRDVPLNTMWLREVAHLCADALFRADEGRLQLPLTCRLDLACWSEPALDGLREALSALDRDVTTIQMLPALEVDATSLDTGWLWVGPDGVAFGAAVVAASGVAEIVAPDLSSTRRRRLIDLAEACDLAMEPGPPEIAAFAVDVAKDMAERDTPAEQWAQFYDDLSEHRGVETHLTGVPLLAGDAGALLNTNAPDSSVTVFFPPGADDETVEDGDVPALVLQRLAFLRNLPFVDRTSGRRRRPGRVWLEAHGLVREYRSDAVLDLLGQVMRSAKPSAPELTGVLEFAFRLWAGSTRDIGSTAVSAARLLVPTRDGWSPAATAVFGRGWSGPEEETDVVLARLLDAAKDVSEDLAGLYKRTLVEPALVSSSAVVDSQRWTQFLEALGVGHGLVPRVRSTGFRLRGGQVNHPSRVSFAVVPAKEQDQWRAFAEQELRGTVTFETTEYTPVAGVADLPGQWDWQALDTPRRADYAHLVVTGLARWRDSVLEIEFGRSTDSRRAVWPSPVAYFLWSRPWVPQTTPGNRTETSLARPRDAWWVVNVDTPDFLPAEPPLLRRLATPRAVARLRKAGVRVWDESASAAARLVELARHVEGRTLESRTVLALAIRKANELAWQDLIDERLTPPQSVVVTRHGEFGTASLGEEPIYVPDRAGVGREALLAQTPLALLPLKQLGLAEQILAEHGPTLGLLPASLADVRLKLDGEWAETLARVRLQDVAPDWLGLLVLAVMEFKHRGVPSVGVADLRRAAGDLATASVAVGQTLTMYVGGHPVETLERTDSFLTENQDGKFLVVGGNPSEDEFPGAVAAALSELVGLPALADQLRLALFELRRRTDGIPPTANDIGAVVGATAHDIADLQRLVKGGTSDWSAVVAALALVDPASAHALRDSAATLASTPEMHAWLEERLAGSGWDSAQILAASEQRDLHASVELLGVGLAQANAGLRDVGLASLHNAEGHMLQMAAYIAAHRSRINDRLRDLFAPSINDPDRMREYLRLRELPGPTPDPAWLDAYWDVPETAFAERVEQWLLGSAGHRDIDDVPSPIEPVEVLRETGRRVVTSVTQLARVLVEAWLHRHAAGQGARPPEASVAITAITATGMMDFGRLTSDQVLHWLRSNDGWPDGMKLTTSRTALGLTEADLAAARERLSHARETARRQSTYVQFGGRTYSEDPDDLRALAIAVQEQAAGEALDVSIEPVGLVALAPAERSDRDRGREGGAGRGSQPPPEKTKAIGLVGEMFVGEWLRQQLGLPIEETWVSAYRTEILGDGKGNDGLGFDFQVVRSDGTWLFEVKATTGGDNEFALGEAEVRRAQNLKPHETYTVVLVNHVLVPGQRRLTPLPNPLGPGGLSRFRVLGSALRLKFERADA